MNNSNKQTHLKQTAMKKVIATRISAEDLKNDSAREFNPQTWVENVNRYSRFKDVEFFKVDADETYEYSRFYVAYTLPEGLRLMNTFSYSSSITNGGFYMCLILEGELNVETNEYTSYENNKVAIMTKGFGKENLPLNNSAEARKYMIEWSNKVGSVFTKGGIY